jgi:hypothetical protein
LDTARELLRCLFVFGGILVSGPLANCAAAENAEVKMTDVQIAMPKNVVYPQQKLTIYRVPGPESDWPTTQAEVAIEKEAKVSLPDGDYVAEVNVAFKGVLVLLRSAAFNVPKTHRIELAAQAHSCAATILNKPAKVLQVALRRFGSGEVRWTADNSRAPVVIYTSPNESYLTSCVAELDHTYMAIWSPKQVLKKAKLTFSDADGRNQLKFVVREGTPELSRTKAIVYFPDTAFTV